MRAVQRSGEELRDPDAGPPPMIRALLRPEAYPHPSDDLQLRETHISWVILAGAYAYKLKKPVRFEFLDFTTFERRANDAEEEVRLNRRLAPSVYLGIVDVVERDGAIWMGGPGRVIERAVWMRRLPEEGMLVVLLARDAVKPALIRRMARELAAFHREAATGPGVDQHGTWCRVEENWWDNFAQMEPYVGVTIPAWNFRRIRSYVTEFLVARRRLFRDRVARGRIRDCHGDLHAANICVVNGGPIIFDCLEFDARYRCSDVAAEVAYLAMDLDHAGRADLGHVFVSEYVRASGDQQLLEVLDFYKCYRAFLRGEVMSLRLGGLPAATEERTHTMASARAYFDLATAYAREGKGPRLLAMC